MPATAAFHRRDRLAPVEEAHRTQRSSRGGEHEELGWGRRTLARLGRDPRDRRAVHDGDVAGRESSVREELIAHRIHVLRFLEVRGAGGNEPFPRAQHGRLARQREDRDAADRVIGRGADERPPVADHERIRIDARAEIEHAQGERRPAGCDAVRDQTEKRRLHVVHPGPEEIVAGERASREPVAARVDRDVVRLCAREDRCGGADVDREVEREVVDVDGSACVSLDVVLVRRAEHPRVNQGAG